MSHQVYFGIDVSKHYLDLGTTDRHLKRFANTAEGRTAIMQVIVKQDPALVVVEATGGYENALVQCCFQVSCPIAVVQPNRIHHFAKSLNQQAKTDAIDAVMIARFGAAIQPRISSPIDETVIALRALRDRRSQLIEDRKRERNRLECCFYDPIRHEYQASIQRLTSEIKSTDQAIREAISANAELKRKDLALQQQPGVGPQTSVTLLTLLPELGRLNRNQVAALGGLAPYNNDSGSREGKRSIFGGREVIRRTVYMATLSAVRCATPLKNYYQRLREAGKPAKVALVACARKLLTWLNSVISRMLTPPQAASEA